MRPAQWAKNVFVVAPWVFALADRRPERMLAERAGSQVLWACLAFCAASSAVYLWNDVLDVESDRAHPEKRRRPVAAGELSKRAALTASALLAVGALAVGVWIDAHGAARDDGWNLGPIGGALVAYVGVNVGYGLGLKAIVLVDAFCIAAGFLLRVTAGGAAAGVEVSHWLFLCTLFLALFLALCKRRAEMSALGPDGVAHRATLGGYSPGFLDQMVGVLAACTILCYTMYTVGEGTAVKFGAEGRIVWSVPFVAFGVGRYMMLVQSGRGGGDPTRVLLGADPIFLANSLGWAGVVAWALFA